MVMFGAYYGQAIDRVCLVHCIAQVLVELVPC